MVLSTIDVVSVVFPSDEYFIDEFILYFANECIYLSEK